MSKFMSGPRQSHLRVVERIVRYLKRTLSNGIIFSHKAIKDNHIHLVFWFLLVCLLVLKWLKCQERGGGGIG